MSLEFSFIVSFFKGEYVETLCFFFAMSALIIFATLIIISSSGSSIIDVTLKIEVAFSLWIQIAANLDAFKM